LDLAVSYWNFLDKKGNNILIFNKIMNISELYWIIEWQTVAPPLTPFY